jgi:hypothetical protein
MKLLIALVAMFQLSAFAQQQVTILDGSKRVFDTSFTSNVLKDSFIFNDSLFNSVVGVKIGTTSEGLKAEVEKYTMHVTWRGPKARYIVNNDEISVSVSALKLGGNNDQTTITKTYRLNKDGAIEMISENKEIVPNLDI